MAAIKPLAIIAGVGPGTGTSLALKFAREYTVVLLSRTAASFDPVVSEIQSNGGEAYGIQTDISNEKSVKDAFAQIKSRHADTPVAAAIFNASTGPVRKPFLEVTVGEWDGAWAVNGHGAFIFSQSTLPLLSSSTHLPRPPTLIFTGATASVKSSAFFTTFAAGKFALRALSQSLAREFGPKGVHVSHAIIDGVIDIPKSKEWLTEVPDAKISSNAIADAYWNLHTQPRTAFTWEIDIRPYVEKW